MVYRMASAIVNSDQKNAVSGTIPEMEAAFQSGVETGLIPGAVVMAKDLRGTQFINLP